METERLMIDSIRETDKEDYFINISHDKKVLESFICRYADTMEEFDFSSYLGRQDLFPIRLKETGRLVGILSLFDEKDGACEIGYGIGSRFWNRGYATEAVGRFLEYLFREKGMRRVYASFFTGNDASRRVMEKCGMTFDHFSEKELSYLGVERDLTYYVIRRKPEVILLNGPSSAGKSSIEKIESFVKKLERLYPDIEYVNRLMTHSWGQRAVRFYDPDGNLIEVDIPV